MKSNKNTQTYLNKYIKTQNPYNQGKSKKQNTQEPIIYKILNEIKHKKQRFHREENNKQFYIQTKKRTELKAKGTHKEISKNKNINNCLGKYIQYCYYVSYNTLRRK